MNTTTTLSSIRNCVVTVPPPVTTGAVTKTASANGLWDVYSYAAGTGSTFKSNIATTIYIVCIAPGGNGGADYSGYSGGGGGAGGFIESSYNIASGETLTINVGGITAINSTQQTANSTVSTVPSLTAIGGGKGVADNLNTTSKNGGNGGGGSSFGTYFGTGATGGYNGGVGIGGGGTGGGGGGGGAGGAGTNATTTAGGGVGGAGKTISNSDKFPTGITYCVGGNGISKPIKAGDGAGATIPGCGGGGSRYDVGGLGAAGLVMISVHV